MKRILLTGGTGFFGKSLLDALLAGGYPEYRWLVLSRDPEHFLETCPEFRALADRVEFLRGDIRSFTFPGGRFDAVLHAATPAVLGMDDREMESIIVDGTKHVLDFLDA